MAWVIRGESLKQKRRDRRSRLRNAPSFQSQNSSVNTKSPQSTDPPSDDNSMPPSSLVAHCDVLADTRGVELTEGTHHDEVEPTSNLHSQLPQQSSQSSATTIPTSEVRHRNEHIPLMPQSLYQQRLFSHPIQNTLGTQTQIGLLSPITLNQIKQQLFSRHLLSLNQHQTYNFPPASTLPPAIFASNSLFAGVGIPQSQSVQSNRLHNPLQQFFTPSFRSGISNNLQLQSNNLLAGLPNISWGQQQPDQSANLLMLQRNQLSVFSNNMFSNHCLQPHQPGLLSSPLNQLNQAQTAQSQLNTGDPSTTQILPTISSISNCGKSDPSLLSSEKKTQIKKRRWSIAQGVSQRQHNPSLWLVASTLALAHTEQWFADISYVVLSSKVKSLEREASAFMLLSQSGGRIMSWYYFILSRWSSHWTSQFIHNILTDVRCRMCGFENLTSSFYIIWTSRLCPILSETQSNHYNMAILLVKTSDY